MSIYLGVRKAVELKNSKIPEMKNYLKKDGSVSMAGNLDLGNYAIDNLKTYPENNHNAASKKYVDDEDAKFLDLSGNRQMKGDLFMGDNAIVGVEDINADNSVPSKKYVKDSFKSRDAKITANENQAHLNATKNLNMQNEINALKNSALYSHYGSFIYSNPVKNVYKEPFIFPSGYPDDFFWLTPDYNDETRLTILGLNTDNDNNASNNECEFFCRRHFLQQKWRI